MTSNTIWITSLLNSLPVAIVAIGAIHVGLNLLIRIRSPHTTPVKMLSKTAFADSLGIVGIFGVVAALSLLANAVFIATKALGIYTFRTETPAASGDTVTVALRKDAYDKPDTPAYLIVAAAPSAEDPQ